LRADFRRIADKTDFFRSLFLMSVFVEIAVGDVGSRLRATRRRRTDRRRGASSGLRRIVDRQSLRRRVAPALRQSVPRCSGAGGDVSGGVPDVALASRRRDADADAAADGGAVAGNGAYTPELGARSNLVDDFQIETKKQEERNEETSQIGEDDFVGPYVDFVLA